jgi:hypothetical protein
MRPPEGNDSREQQGLSVGHFDEGLQVMDPEFCPIATAADNAATMADERRTIVADSNDRLSVKKKKVLYMSRHV